MNNIFKISLILCLPMLVWANNPGKEGKYKEQKTIKKEFDVNANATLEIDNQFGTVDIATWDENRIVVEVTIKTTGDKKEDVKEKLDEINVKFENSSSYVHATTVMGQKKGKNKWKWKWKSGSKCKATFEINYSVRMPKTNSLDISNDFGVFTLDELDGNLTLNSDHSQLIIGRLNGSNNQLSFDFGNNSSIQFVERAIIDSDHSNFTIDEAVELNIDGDFCTTTLKDVKELEFDSDHTKYTIDLVESISADGDFTIMNVSELKNRLELDGDHSKLNIEKAHNSCKKIEVEGDFTLFKLSNTRDYDFSFIIDTENGKVRGLDLLNVTKKVIDGADARYEGTRGSGTNSLIFISDFGQITFEN